jgi:hypothetical protein
MPFELGLAFALRRFRPDFKILLFEKVSDRLRDTLSDLSGRDPLIHEGRPRTLISCLLGALGTGEPSPSIEQVYRLYRETWSTTKKIKKAHGRDRLFHPSIFRETILAAGTLAASMGLIRP